MKLVRIYQKLSYRDKFERNWGEINQSRAYASLRPLSGTARVITWAIPILGQDYLFIAAGGLFVYFVSTNYDYWLYHRAKHW